MLKQATMQFLLLLAALQGFAQGQFYFANPSAPTRVGSVSGPLAGTNVWAHMLAGVAADSLEPVGPDLRHGPDGLVYGGGPITVPGIPQGSYAYVQMVAWDGSQWGTMLSGVPAEQLGRTDSVRTFLGGSAFPLGPPFFTQPAIVPIPEPSLAALGVLALLAVLGRGLARCA